MKTSNISSNFGIIHYGWNAKYAVPGSQDDTGKEGRLLNVGPHYVNLSRTKKIGGTLEIDCFGPISDVMIGDWIVFKISSKAPFTKENFKENGLVKFIGQIYSKNIQNVADGDGNIRVITAMSVREWSHVFNVQVKLDQISRILNTLKTSSAENLKKEISSVVGPEAASKTLEKALKARSNPFEFVSFLLQVVGALGANTNTVRETEKIERLEVISRLPLVPEKLVKDHVSIDSSFNFKTPWSTGFSKQIIGVQTLGGKPNKSEEFYTSDDVEKAYGLETSTRPGALQNPLDLSKNIPLIDMLTSQFGESDSYEFYSDILYFGKTVIPALIVRDKPLSFSKIWQADPASALTGPSIASLNAGTSKPNVTNPKEGPFKWTYFDYIPRTTVPATNVINININHNFTQAYNFFRFNFNPGVVLGASATGAATVNGTKWNIPSQFRFGTIEYERFVNSYLESKKTAKGEFKPSEGWFEALSLKSLNYYSYKYLFPDMTLTIKDDDFPIVVGNMLRIPLGNNRLTVVGEVQSIQIQSKVLGDGKHENMTYIRISDCGFEDPASNKILPFPSRALENLTRYPADASDLYETADIWKFIE